jgi:hypothetical protein
MIRTLFLQQIVKEIHTPRKREAWDILRPIIFGIGLMFALIPSFYTITDHEFVILPMMGIVIFTTHLALTLHTLSVAASVHSQGKGEEAWDVLAVTGISARRWVWQTWQATLQRVWFDHIIFSLLRLGLAVGIAELLHMVPFSPLNRLGLVTFHYTSQELFIGGTLDPLAPELIKIIFAGIMLAGFAIMEAGLLAACDLVVAMWNVKGNVMSRIGVSLLVRALFVCGIIGTGAVVNSLRDPMIKEMYCHPGSLCNTYVVYNADGYGASSQPNNATIGRFKADFTELSIFVNTTMIGFSALGDNATLLAADMLRPSYGVISMIRNIPHILIGIGLYWGVIRLLLWGARRLAVWRGMLP